MYTEYKHNIDVNIHVQLENFTVQIPIGDRTHLPKGGGDFAPANSCVGVTISSSLTPKPTTSPSREVILAIGDCKISFDLWETYYQ